MGYSLRNVDIQSLPLPQDAVFTSLGVSAIFGCHLWQLPSHEIECE